MVYFYSLIFFRILALENIAKILTTGPRLGNSGIYEPAHKNLVIIAYNMGPAKAQTIN